MSNRGDFGLPGPSVKRLVPVLRRQLEARAIGVAKPRIETDKLLAMRLLVAPDQSGGELQRVSGAKRMHRHQRSKGRGYNRES